MTTAQRLRLWMQYREESVRGLAVKAGLEPRTIQDIRAGKTKNPTGETLERICAALGISVSEFWHTSLRPCHHCGGVGVAKYQEVD